MKIIDKYWLSQSMEPWCFGIILIQQEPTGKYKAYIGAVADGNEDADVQTIIQRGAKLRTEDAKRFFPKYADDEWAE